MSEVPSKTKTWVVLITLLGLSAVMAYQFTPSGEASWGEPDPIESAPEPSRSRGGAEIGPPADLDEDVDEAGSSRSERGERHAVMSDAGPTSAAPTPVAVAAPAAAEESADEPPAPREPAPLPVQVEEQTPERVHSRAVFFRDLLEQRMVDTEAAAAAARAEGNPNRAARLERQAARLAGQLPHADEVEADRAARAEEARREEEGEALVEDEPPESADDEATEDAESEPAAESDEPAW